MIRKIIILFCLAPLLLLAEAAVEDDDSFLQLEAADANQEMGNLREEIEKKYDIAKEMLERNASDDEFKVLLGEINQLKKQLHEEQIEWKKKASSDESQIKEDYAYWDQGETTLSSLVMEYGSTQYLYVIPYEIGSMKINLYSTIAIPQESWDEMITMILIHNGIGVKQINPYLRQLYILKHDPSFVEAVTHNMGDLNHIKDSSCVFHVFNVPEEKVKSAENFFQRFSDPKQTTIQSMAGKIILIGTKENIIRLIQLYEAVWDKDSDKSMATLSLKKLQIKEAEQILRSFFQEGSHRGRPPIYSSMSDELQIFPLSQTNQLVLIGSDYLINRSRKIIEDLEMQVDEPGEKVIFWYTCKHTNPEDIASVLNQVYHSLSHSSLPQEKKSVGIQENITQNINTKDPASSNRINLPVNPPKVEPGSFTAAQNAEKKSHGNFIVDGKTGSILMVVRKEDLPKIKNLLKKLDIPKQMAQIDVLLVEKKLIDRQQMGINLLKIGNGSKNQKQTAFDFDAQKGTGKQGVLDFIISRSKGKLPSFDFAMSFLMGQEDLRINANPSVLAINQTPATISIVDEVSINNGAVASESGNRIEKSFTRAQYGINIILTPTIHPPDDNEEEAKGHITLQADITFDTPHSLDNERPPVTRRHIINEVRVADGETIILGGLRRLSDEASREKIPFLGDIPGIGKLFGTTKQSENSTEMFIFITPKIIKDSVMDLQKIRQKELEKRPGDIPEFITKIEKAKQEQKRRAFAQTMKVLFDER